MEESATANKIYDEVSHLPLSIQHMLVQDIMREEVKQRMSSLPAQEKAQLCQRITANINQEISGTRKKLITARGHQEKRKRSKEASRSDHEDEKDVKRPQKDSSVQPCPPLPKHKCSLCKSPDHTVRKCPIVLTLKNHVK